LHGYARRKLEEEEDIWDIEITILNNEFASRETLEGESHIATPTSQLSKSQLAKQQRQMVQINEQRMKDGLPPVKLHQIKDQRIKEQIEVPNRELKLFLMITSKKLRGESKIDNGEWRRDFIQL